eukprot:639468-Prymnesium_polylepis.1
MNFHPFAKFSICSVHLPLQGTDRTLLSIQTLLSICGVFNQALKISQGGREELLFIGGLSVVVVWGVMEVVFVVECCG